MEPIECSLCGKEHKTPESQICEECLKNLEGALLGRTTLSVDQAKNLAWLLGNIDLVRRWASSQILSHKDQIDQLTLDFEKHGHLPVLKGGTVVLPYERRVIIPLRRP